MHRETALTLALLLGCASTSAEEPAATTATPTTSTTAGDDTLPAAPTVTGPEAREFLPHEVRANWALGPGGPPASPGGSSRFPLRVIR